MGDHQHGPPAGGQGFASSVGGQGNLGSGGSARYLVNDYFFGTSMAGGHGHGLSIDGVGDHNHYVNGDTSGGFEQDNPSFLTVGFIINY